MTYNEAISNFTQTANDALITFEPVSDPSFKRGTIQSLTSYFQSFSERMIELERHLVEKANSILSNISGSERDKLKDDFQKIAVETIGKFVSTYKPKTSST